MSVDQRLKIHSGSDVIAKGMPIAKKSTSNPLSPEWVSDQLSPYLNRPLIVAFSGGVDSTVLLNLLVQLRDSGVIHLLSAVHVHHGLNPDADAWASHCQSLCDSWAVPLQIKRVAVKAQGKGIEQAARQARYDVFEQAVSNGGCLLQGHHRDDQAETVLLRLFRGTGLEGLQGMPSVRPLGCGLLFRPLLSVPRAAIEACARRYELSFIEDDSNRDERFSRNYLRCSLIPEVERRWPGVAERLTELASEIEEINDHHRLQVDTLLKSAVEYRPGWLLGQQPLLAISQLVQLDYPMQKQVVRHWLKSQGWMAPARDALTRMFDQVVSARGDAEPCLNIGGYSIRRFRGLLMATGALSLEAFEPFLWDWQKSPQVRLGERRLHWVSASEGDGGSVHLPARPLMVRRRCHGGQEKIAIAGRTGRKTLKRWLQEYHVPPWLREYLPLIYDGERMVAAPGLWVCEGCQSTGGEGFRLDWN